MKLEDINSPILINTKCFTDDRGEFTKLFDAEIFNTSKLRIVDINIVHTSGRYVFRGFHWQEKPNQEYKIVKCIEGSIIDVCIDIENKDLELVSFPLNASDNKSIVIPPNFAHGYLIISSRATVVYGTTAHYVPESERGIRWNDPKIEWNLPKPTKVSSKDGSWKNWI